MASTKELRALITLAGKIDPSLQAAMLKATGMNTKMAQQSQKSAGSMSKAWNIAKGVFAGNIMTKGLSMTVEGIKRVGTEGINLASDLTEVQNVVDTTFGKDSKKINDWSSKALNAFGLSELQAKKFTGTMGAMLKSSGISSKYLVKMSEGLTGLSGDFASFYNLDHQEAFDKIRAGISGETEPLKQLGINMSVANLEAFAMSKGIKTSYQKMDQASQVLLRYNYLMEQSKDAQGDFAKTLDSSFANQKRVAITRFNQTLSLLAEKLLPVATKALQGVNTSLTNFTSNPERIDAIASKIAMIGSNAMEVLKWVAPKVSWIITIGIPGIIKTLNDLMPVIIGVGAAVVAWKITKTVQDITGAFNSARLALKLFSMGQSSAAIQQAVLSGTFTVGETIVGLLTGKIKIATVAQKLWNLAMSANPMGLVAVGIGVLITAGILLYKNFDKVRNAATWLWDKFTGIIKGMPNFTSALAGPLAPLLSLIKNFEKVKNLASGAIGAVKRFFGGKSKDNGDESTDSSLLVSKNMDAYAEGGFANKASIFAEAGPEAAIPLKYKNPRSIAILNKTAQAIGATPSSGGAPSMQFNFNFNGPVSNKEEVTEGVMQAKQYIIDVLDEYFEGRTALG